MWAESNPNSSPIPADFGVLYRRSGVVGGEVFAEEVVEEAVAAAQFEQHRGFARARFSQNQQALADFLKAFPNGRFGSGFLGWRKPPQALNSGKHFC